jgi:hypothetical protein
MPHYKDMEEEFKAAKIKDLKTNKTSSWPYEKSTDQIVYENWLTDVPFIALIEMVRVPWIKSMSLYRNLR